MEIPRPCALDKTALSERNLKYISWVVMFRDPLERLASRKPQFDSILLVEGIISDKCYELGDSFRHISTNVFMPIGAGSKNTVNPCLYSTTQN